MSATYKLNRHCPVCGKKIADKSKTGFCNIHRDRTGANNPFYGKTHSKETLDLLKEKCKIASTKKWEDPEYAQHVKDGLKSEKNIAAHTSDEFRKTQGEHAKQQMQDPNQLEIRSTIMKESWQSGKIEFHIHRSPNFSKDEICFGDLLEKALGDKSYLLDRKFKVSRLDNPNRKYCPDFKYNNYIIEFDGDFWHARNREDNDVVHHGRTAKEIRASDKAKDDAYRHYGYTVIRIWQSDFLANKERCIGAVVSTITDGEL